MKHMSSKNKRSKNKRSKNKRSKNKRSKNKSSKSRKYKMRGGSTTSATINSTGPGPTPPPPPSHVSEDINAKNSEQNSHAKMGGGKRSRKSKRSSKSKRGGKRPRSRKSKRRSKSKRGGKRPRSSKRQRGGMADAVMCNSSLINSADGFGYDAPGGCIQVPSVNNPSAQSLAITSSNINYTAQANRQYDS